MNGGRGKQHDDGVGTANFCFDLLGPLDPDTQVAVDENLVAMLTQFGFEQIQQPSIRLHIRFVNDGNQPGLHNRASLAEWRRDFSRWSIYHRLSPRQRFAHFFRRLITLPRVVSARLEEDFVELEESLFDFTSV